MYTMSSNVTQFHRESEQSVDNFVVNYIGAVINASNSEVFNSIQSIHKVLAATSDADYVITFGKSICTTEHHAQIATEILTKVTCLHNSSTQTQCKCKTGDTCILRAAVLAEMSSKKKQKNSSDDKSSDSKRNPAIVELYLCRRCLYRVTLKCVLDYQPSPGSVGGGNKPSSVAISHYHTRCHQTSALTTLRGHLISQHIKQILENESSLSSEVKLVNVSSSSVQDIVLTVCCKQQTMDVEEAARMMFAECWVENKDKYKVVEGRCRKAAEDSVYVTSTGSGIVVDVMRYLADTDRHADVHLIKTSPTVKLDDYLQDIISLSIHIEELLSRNVDVNVSDGVVSVIHVASHSNEFRCRMQNLLYDLLTGQSIKHVYIIHGHVVVSDGESVGLREYIQYVYGEMTGRTQHKYPHMDPSSEVWHHHVAAVTAAYLTYLMLSPSYRKCVKVQYSSKPATRAEVGLRQDRCNGTFVLYNYARLCTLFQSYEDQVSKGAYSKMPDIEDIDFTALSDADEWTLLLQFVAEFPAIIKPHPDTPLECFNTHKVCQYTASLCHTLSRYYSRVHVLCDSRATQASHTLPNTMWARLYLLNAIRKLLKQALQTLNITPLQEM